MPKEELEMRVLVRESDVIDRTNGSKLTKALNHLWKKYIEQEPCDAAVNKAEIIHELNRLGRNAFKDDTDYDNFFAFVDSLPLVTPKIGHWIWDRKSNVYRCTCCNQFPWRINTGENDEVFIDMKRTNAYKFCPNCGAKMVESEG